MLHPAKARVGPPARIAAAARRELAGLSRPAASFDASRYFRGTPDLGFFNVGTGRVRQIAREIVAANRANWSMDEAMAFADVLIRDRHLEVEGPGRRGRGSLPPRVCAASPRRLETLAGERLFGELGDDRRDLRHVDRPAAARTSGAGPQRARRGAGIATCGSGGRRRSASLRRRARDAHSIPRTPSPACSTTMRPI